MITSDRVTSASNVNVEPFVQLAMASSMVAYSVLPTFATFVVATVAGWFAAAVARIITGNKSKTNNRHTKIFHEI